MTSTNPRRNDQGFSLVEIMIVVAIIGLLAGLAIPTFVKARKQSQGRRILNDVRQMDAAIDQWAMEKTKLDGDAIDTTAAQSYSKFPWSTTDLSGNPYNITVVGSTQISINVATKAALDGVGIDWGKY